jgi:F0F1-type ATP synthase assembly protein I
MSPSRTIVALVGGLFGEPELSGDVPLNAALGVMAAVIAICCAVMFAWYQRRD